MPMALRRLLGARGRVQGGPVGVIFRMGIGMGMCRPMPAVAGQGMAVALLLVGSARSFDPSPLRSLAAQDEDSDLDLLTTGSTRTPVRSSYFAPPP